VYKTSVNEKLCVRNEFKEESSLKKKQMISWDKPWSHSVLMPCNNFENELFIYPSFLMITQSMCIEAID